jgi:hypothetical protein
MRRVRSLREKKGFLNGLLCCVCVLILLSVLIRSYWILALGVAATVLFMVLFWKWWRCPACGMHLGRMEAQGRFCTHCGQAIDWDKK